MLLWTSCCGMSRYLCHMYSILFTTDSSWIYTSVWRKTDQAHTKAKILSLCNVDPNLYHSLSFVKKKKSFSIFFFWSIPWKSMVTKTAWLPTFDKISSLMFCLCRKNKFIHVWSDMRINKRQNFPFLVKYPLILSHLFFNLISFGLW